jgi:hypothetical protein
MHAKKNLPRSIRITHIFLLLGAVIWMAFGIITAAGAHPAIPEVGTIRWAMAIMAVLTSVCMLAFSYLLPKRNSFAYWLTLGLLFTIVIITITDEFGLADLIVLIIHVVPLAILIRERQWFRQPIMDNQDPK